MRRREPRWRRRPRPAAGPSTTPAGWRTRSPTAAGRRRRTSAVKSPRTVGRYLAIEPPGLERHVEAARRAAPRTDRGRGPADPRAAAALRAAEPGVRTDQRDPPRRRRQRQQAALVLQQHHRPGGGAPDDPAGRRVVGRHLGGAGAAAPVHSPSARSRATDRSRSCSSTSPGRTASSRWAPRCERRTGHLEVEPGEQRRGGAVGAEPVADHRRRRSPTRRAARR